MTAVEWLEKKLDDALCDTDYITWQLVCKAVKEAKQMEKQQIIDFNNWIRKCKLKQRPYDFENIEELLRIYKEEKGL